MPGPTKATGKATKECTAQRLCARSCSPSCFSAIQRMLGLFQSGPFLSPQHQAKALQQLQQQQQAYQHQLHQQQAAAQQLAAQQAAAASSGHPIADLRAGQLPSGGTDVTAH
ncbi:hypothetical protein Vretifemale_8458, partial [Volvox reticuliferus]